MSISQASHPSAPERAYLWLREQIAQLPWDREDFLSENTIAEASGTSRTPVREALLRLEGEGLLRRIPHKGVYIPALTTKDLNEIMEVRQVIGEWATRRVTEKRSAQLLATLENLIAEQQRHTSDPVRFIELDIAFHKEIVHGAGNSTLAQVYDSQRFKQERVGIQAVLATQGRYDLVIAEHRALLDGIASGDPEIAATAAKSHIESTRRALNSQYGS